MTRWSPHSQKARRRSGRKVKDRSPRLFAEALEDRQLMDASTTLFFDFGPAGGAAASGSVPFSVQPYTPSRGYGWTRGVELYTGDSGVGDALARDCTFARSASFAVDLPDGSYTVTAIQGCTWNTSMLGSLTAEGQTAASNVLVGRGESQQISFPVTVSDGQLNLDFGGGFFYLQGLRIDGAVSADAGPDLAGTEGSPIAFAGRGFGGSSSIYSWDFGDGATAGTLTPTHIYLDSGTYTATLTAVDGATGARAVSSATVTVADVAPIGDAGGPYNGTVASPIIFGATATDASPVDAAAGLIYSWDFGDGTEAAGPSPSHAYGAPGTYAVTLTVRDKDGGASSTTTTADVAPYVNSMMIGHMIPNFAAMPTIISVKSGPWSDPSTWSNGRIPAAGDVVAIAGGTDVTYGIISDTAIKTLAVEPAGKLEFSTDESTKLVVGNFLVMPDGDLEIGTQERPIAADASASIVFADQAIDLMMDPEQFGTGLVAMGRVSMVGAAMNSTFLKLAAEPRTGDWTLTLAQPAIGWKPGDRLVLPDTRELQWNEKGSSYVPQWEELTLANVSPDGRTLTLTAPLKFNHLGARDGDGNLTFLPDIGDITRNVVISSQNPDGTRGHTMFMGQADVDIRYVSFHELGRTKIGPLDSTTFDASGNVTHIGTNQIARYPLHMHYLSGPSQGRSDGYQFTLIGNSVDDGSNDRPYKWGIDVHHSSYGLIRDNVVYNTAGAGISTEDGSESYNVFEHNFVSRVHGTGSEFDQNGSVGAAFWFKGPNNYIRDNVAANAYGGTYNAGFDIQAYYTGMQRVPKYPGASTFLDGQYDTINMNSVPLLEFARNESYGAMPVGLSLWWIGTAAATPADVGESVVKDFHTWNVYDSGIFNWPTNHVTYDGYVARGQRYIARGMTFSDYVQQGMLVMNANIQGMYQGIAVSAAGGMTTVIQDSYMRNFVGVAITSLATVSYRSDQMKPRTTIIRNVKFDTQGVPQNNKQDPLTIEMNYGWSSNLNPNLTQQDRVFVYDYNQVSGDDFQLYYLEQASDFLVPSSIYNNDGTLKLTAAPVGGLTNQQLWARYGLAIAGAVAPTTTRRDGIRGLINPL